MRNEPESLVERGEAMRRDITPVMKTLLLQSGDTDASAETAELLADLAGAFMIDLTTESARLCAAVNAASPSMPPSSLTHKHVIATVRKHAAMFDRVNHIVQHNEFDKDARRDTKTNTRGYA
jgi:hypothetical protein